LLNEKIQDDFNNLLTKHYFQFKILMAVKWTAKYTYLKIYRTGVEANGTLVYRVSDPYIGNHLQDKKDFAQ
jgi:hypothetical protein